MQVLDVEPNSDEHFKIRKNYWCASEASAVMNISPFQPYNREELALVKKGLLTVPYYQEAVSWGQKHESKARDMVENEFCSKFTPQICVKDKMLASPDGLNGNIYLEIKCPLSPKSETIKLAEENKIPEHYQFQLHHGMYVTGCKRALFTVLYPDLKTIKFIWFEADYQQQAVLLNAWSEFNELMKKPNFELVKLSKNNLEGKELQQVQSLIHAKQILDQAKSDYDEIAKNSINILRGIKFRHPQVSLIAEQKKKGTINWNTAFKDIEKFLPKDFDIENYRSKEQTTKPYFKFK
tara:strand:+ start:369 stop:1250 length:882 start_codon:yes stop_codon:yes gene_type:complete